MLLEPVGYIPAILWVTVILLSRTRIIPTWLAFLGFAIMGVLNGLLNGPLPALAACGGALILGALLALLNASSRLTTILVVGVLASVPVLSWWVILPGVVAAALVSAYRIRKVAGKGYLTMLTGETMASVDVSSYLRGTSPDISRLPLPEKSEEPLSQDTLTGKVASVKVLLSAYILAGLVGVFVLSLIMR